MLSRRIVLRLAATLPLTAAVPAVAAAAPLSVVASFSILADMVKEIGGGHVAVTTLGPNGDAHVYEPPPADIAALGRADCLVMNGLDFESWMPRLLTSAGFKGREIVASAGIAPRHFDDGQADPHAWQDLANGMRYVDTIAAGLAAADPERAAHYAANAGAYRARLAGLDAEVRSAFARIPESRRKIVTSHDAFGYFGAAYGVAFIAAAGVSTEAEASAADVARIIDQIRREKITAVFVENITNTKLTGQIARETGARIGGELYSDALSPPDGDAPSYIAMFEWNVRQLTNALSVS